MRLTAKVALATIAVDQLSKYGVVHLLRLDQRQSIDVLPPLLNLRMAWNQGVNFGLFSNGADLVRWVLIVLALAISVWVWLWVKKGGFGWKVLVSAGLLIGGAIGNVIDRLVYGAVADFLNMSCCGIENPYSFNVADIAIFAGALGLVVFGNKPADA